MGYLDNEGLAHLWTKIREALGTKQGKLSGGLGQIVGFSQNGVAEAQYLNLAHLSDGNPIGTIISFLGTSAPKDYLVCDGTEYGISEYPALADFFRQQFGTADYFGGDGSATFAVPDMRNLFLRGYHGEAEEALSGEIGQRQEATRLLSFVSDRTHGAFGAYANGTNYPELVDSYAGENAGVVISNFTGSNPQDVRPPYYTSRPVNMAVLYCIKAV